MQHAHVETTNTTAEQHLETRKVVRLEAANARQARTGGEWGGGGGRTRVETLGDGGGVPEKLVAEWARHARGQQLPLHRHHLGRPARHRRRHPWRRRLSPVRHEATEPLTFMRGRRAAARRRVPLPTDQVAALIRESRGGGASGRDPSTGSNQDWIFTAEMAEAGVKERVSTADSKEKGEGSKDDDDAREREREAKEGKRK